MTGFSLKALHYANQTVPGAQVFFLDGYDEWMDFYYYAFLARRGDQVVLFDTGMDEMEPFGSWVRQGLGEKGEPRIRKPLTALLAEEGIAPEQVDAVFVSHFHADHVANLDRFPNARIFVSRTGWERLQSIRGEFPQMVPHPLYLDPIMQFTERSVGKAVTLLDDGDTPVEGIRMRHVGGHAVEMTAFEIETSKGPVVLPMDTVWTYRNLEEDKAPGSATDIAECFATMRWVRQTGALMVPSHDPLLLDRHKDGVIAP